MTKERDWNTSINGLEDVDHGWVGQEGRERTLAPGPEVVWMGSKVRRDPISHCSEVIAQPRAFDLIGTKGEVSTYPTMEQIEILLT